MLLFENATQENHVETSINEHKDYRSYSRVRRAFVWVVHTIKVEKYVFLKTEDIGLVYFF